MHLSFQLLNNVEHLCAQSSLKFYLESIAIRTRTSIRNDEGFPSEANVKAGTYFRREKNHNLKCPDINKYFLSI